MFTSLIERLGSGAVDCERAAGSMREVRCWCEVSKEPRSRMCEEHQETVSIFLFKIQIVVEGYKYTIRSCVSRECGTRPAPHRAQPPSRALGAGDVLRVI